MYPVYKTDFAETWRRLSKIVEHSEEGADFDIIICNSTHLISFKKRGRGGKSCRKKFAKNVVNNSVGVGVSENVGF